MFLKNPTDFSREKGWPLLKAYRTLRSLKNCLLNLLDPPVVILLYHRVAELASDPEMLAVSPARFRSQMVFLKQNVRILRLDEEWGGERKPAVVITFDDGYADNAAEALPILEEMKIPATFFISTGNIGSRRTFWWHRLEALLLREGEFPSVLRLPDPEIGAVWPTVTLQDRQRLYGALNYLMQRMQSEIRESLLNRIAAWSNSEGDDPRHRSLIPAEVKRIANSPWATVGAHTVTHTALAALSEAEQRREIFISKRMLEEITGREIRTFSYPFGTRKHYNRTSVRLCREAGFTKAASNFPGQAHRWTDPLQIPRHLVRNWEPEEFAARLQRFWT